MTPEQEEIGSAVFGIVQAIAGSGGGAIELSLMERRALNAYLKETGQGSILPPDMDAPGRSSLYPTLCGVELHPTTAPRRLPC
jgi:hypothetical protein